MGEENEGTTITTVTRIPLASIFLGCMGVLGIGFGFSPALQDSATDTVTAAIHKKAENAEKLAANAVEASVSAGKVAASANDRVVAAIIQMEAIRSDLLSRSSDRITKTEAHGIQASNERIFENIEGAARGNAKDIARLERAVSRLQAATGVD